MSSTSSSSPSLAGEKKPWWLTNRKIVDKYVRDARSLIATQEQSNVSSALGLVEAALALSPRLEAALELKARCLLFLRRFREVAEMLQDYIPSYKLADDESSTSLGSDNSAANLLPKERAKLLAAGEERSDGQRMFRCFSVADLKRKVMAGISRSCEEEGHWRYLVLGQACGHLGLLEDAVVLLQTGRRLAAAAARRQSVGYSSDAFDSPQSHSPESDPTAALLAQSKLLLRRRAAASAALDAGHPAESARHFSKILDARRGGLPRPFAAACHVGRAAALRAAGRLPDALADLNRALALDPANLPALRSRADLLASVRSVPDALRDLAHLKLLLDSQLLRRPKRQLTKVNPVDLRSVNDRIQELRLLSGAVVDYHRLMGVRRGCGRSELERAHMVLTLKHRPEKAAGFVDRVDFAGEAADVDAAREQARMSAAMLYRMLQKGYASVMATVMEEEATAKRKAALKAVAAAAAAAAENIQAVKKIPAVVENIPAAKKIPSAAENIPAVYKGVFCRDMAAVGSLISQVGFGRGIPVKYEAMSC